jgi:hypothetical protein
MRHRAATVATGTYLAAVALSTIPMLNAGAEDNLAGVFLLLLTMPVSMVVVFAPTSTPFSPYLNTEAAALFFIALGAAVNALGIFCVVSVATGWIRGSRSE